MLHFPYTVAITSSYFLQFCYGISIQLHGANLRLSGQKWNMAQSKCVVKIKWLFSAEIKPSLCNSFTVWTKVWLIFEDFNVWEREQWSYWISRRLWLMHSPAGQNFLLCQYSSFSTHLNCIPRCETRWQKLFQVAITIKQVKKTTNFTLVSCRTAILTSKRLFMAVGLYAVMSQSWT